MKKTKLFNFEINNQTLITFGLLIIIVTFFYYEKETLSKEKKDLEEVIKKEDSIIFHYELIISQAINKDERIKQKIDSLNNTRDEYKSKNYSLSDIDSIKRIWAKEYK